MKQTDFLKLQIDELLYGLKKDYAKVVLNQLLQKPGNYNPSNLDFSPLSREEIKRRVSVLTALKTYMSQKSLLGFASSKDNFEPENDCFDKIKDYLEAKLNYVDSLENNSRIRPYYSEEWKKFEQNLQSVNEETLIQIDLYRVQQIREKRPHHWFFRQVYTRVLTTDLQKQNFTEHFPFKGAWLKYEINAKFTEIQRDKIDGIIKEEEDNNGIPLNSFRKIFNDPSLLGQRKSEDDYTTETQLAYFREAFKDQYDWLCFEKEVSNVNPFNEKQREFINAQLVKLYNNELTDKAFIHSLYHQKKLLTNEQKLLLVNSYSKYQLAHSDVDEVLGYRELTKQLQNGQKTPTRSPAKRNITQDEDSDMRDSTTIKKKAKNPKKRLQLTEKKGPSPKKPKQANTLGDSAVDRAIEAGIKEFRKIFSGNSHSTLTLRKVKNSHGKNYLVNIVKIVPPENLTSSETESFGKEVVKRIKELLGRHASKSEQNILLMDKEGAWKVNNMYKQLDGTNVGLALHKNDKLWTVVVRGSTAAILSESIKLTTNPNSPVVSLLSKNMSQTFQTTSQNLVSVETSEKNDDFFANVLTELSSASTNEIAEEPTLRNQNNADADVDIMDAMFEINIDTTSNNLTQEAEEAEKAQFIARIKEVEAEITQLEEEYERAKAYFK